MKARSIARELALLGISQLADTSDEARQNKARQSASRRTASREANREDSQQLSANQLEALLVKALAALSADVGEALETADGELQRSERLILESETRTIEADKVRSRIEPAVPLVETAINRVGGTLEFLVFAQQGDKPRISQAQAALEESANHLQQADQLLTDTESRIADISEVRDAIQHAIAAVKAAMANLRQGLDPSQLKRLIDHADIRSYATDLLGNWISHWRTVDDQLNDAMEKWSIRRLARVDRDILRLAMMEIIYMDVPKRIAIDEAIEMAKRYSDEDSYRFINGVLRRTTDRLDTPKSAEPDELPAQSSEALPTKSLETAEAPQDSLKPITRAPVESKSKAQTSEEEPTATSLEAPNVKDLSTIAEPITDEPSAETSREESVLDEPTLDESALDESASDESASDELVPKSPLEEPPLDEIDTVEATTATENSSPDPIDSKTAPKPSKPKHSIPAPIPKGTPSLQNDNPWPTPE